MKYEELIKYFKFYQENEKQFIETTRFVNVDKKCALAYSYVFANLLLSICSDFESLMRYCFGRHDDEILDIEQIISILESSDFGTNILTQSVKIDGYGEIFPLKIIDYRNHKTFEWWKAYNKIKHNKLKSINVACQANIIKALASLYVLNRYAVKRCAEETDCIDVFIDDVSQFEMTNFETKCSSLVDMIATDCDMILD